MTDPRRARVAVVVPAHQAAAHLDQALASVAAQRWPADEVVVVDDGSSDRTASVASAWAGRLPLTVLARHVTGGPGAARHMAIGASTAPLVALLDADDVWLPDHLETMLDAHAAGTVVTADALRWLPGTGISTVPVSAGAPIPEPPQLARLLRDNFVFAGTLFARELYDRVGGFRDRFVGTEDWDLWIRMVRAGAVVVRAGHPTVLYRLGDHSLSARPALAAHQESVLRQAIDEAASAAEARAARRGLRRVRGAGALQRAYALAREGRPAAARLTAIGATRFGGRAALRAAAVALAPVTTTAARDRRARDPRRRLRP